jgi:hypothetical protein
MATHFHRPSHALAQFPPSLGDLSIIVALVLAALLVLALPLLLAALAEAFRLGGSRAANRGASPARVCPGYTSRPLSTQVRARRQEPPPAARGAV